MQAFLINPAARSITAFQFSGKPEDMAAILSTTLGQVGATAMPTNDRDDVRDALLVARDASDQRMGFFMLAGIPQPLLGCALVVGFANKGGKVAPTDALVGLDWLKANVVWLKIAAEHSVGGSVAFEVITDGGTEAMHNVLTALGQSCEHGNIAVAVERSGKSLH